MARFRDMNEIPFSDQMTIHDVISDVGKTSVIPQLKKSLENLPFLLCGPAGCGKKYLLHQALESRNYHSYDLALISNNKGTIQRLLEKVENRYGGKFSITMNGSLEKTLLVLHGAEHLTAEGAKFLKHKQVVLVCSDRTEELRSSFGNRTVWVNKLTPNETKIFLNKRFPKLQNEQQLVEAIARISNGDLRQAQIQVEFQSGQKDRPSHTYFDAQDALCNGTGESLDYSAALWVQENHTKVENRKKNTRL